MRSVKKQIFVLNMTKLYNCCVTGSHSLLINSKKCEVRVWTAVAGASKNIRCFGARRSFAAVSVRALMGRSSFLA